MRNILVVDDDAGIRTLYARALRQVGHVDVAAGGDEALRLGFQHRYDAIVLDYHMAGVDGLEVLRTLRSKPGPSAATPVLVVTADHREAPQSTAMSLGAVFFATKPVPLPRLVTLVSVMLARRRQEP